MTEKDGPYRGEREPDDQAWRMGEDGRHGPHWEDLKTWEETDVDGRVMRPLEPWEQELLRQGELRAEREAVEAANAKIASASGTEEGEIPGATPRDLADMQALLGGTITAQGGLQLEDSTITLVRSASVGIVTQGDGRPHVAIALHTDDGETYTRALVPFEAMRYARAVLGATEEVLAMLPDDAVDEQDVVDSSREQLETDE